MSSKGLLRAEDIIKSFFPEGCSQQEIGIDRVYLFSISDLSRPKMVESVFNSDIKSERYIKVKRGNNRVGILSTVDVTTSSVDRYYYYYNGRIHKEEHFTMRNGSVNFVAQGRRSDNLYYKIYTLDGDVSIEEYRDHITCQLHRIDGPARVDSLGKMFYVYGKFIGKDLELGSNPKEYLQNYCLL